MTQEMVTDVPVRLEVVTDEIVGVPLAAAVTFTTALPNLEESCVEVAIIVAVPPTGAVAGAVYTPVDETLPALVDQLTAEL